MEMLHLNSNVQGVEKLVFLVCLVFLVFLCFDHNHECTTS
jgi:hypothetical protein